MQGGVGPSATATHVVPRGLQGRDKVQTVTHGHVYLAPDTPRRQQHSSDIFAAATTSAPTLRDTAGGGLSTGAGLVSLNGNTTISWSESAKMLAKKSRLILSDYDKMALQQDAIARHTFELKERNKRLLAQEMRTVLAKQEADNAARKAAEREEWMRAGRAAADDSAAYEAEEKAKADAAVRAAQHQNQVYAKQVAEKQAEEERKRQEELEEGRRLRAEVEEQRRQDLEAKQAHHRRNNEILTQQARDAEELRNRRAAEQREQWERDRKYNEERMAVRSLSVLLLLLSSRACHSPARCS